MAPTPAAGKRGTAVSSAAPSPHVARGDPARASQAALSRHLAPQPDRQRGSPDAQQRQNKVAQQRQNEKAQQRQNEVIQQRQNEAAQQRQNKVTLPQNSDQKGSLRHIEVGSPLHLKEPTLQHLQTPEDEHDPMEEGQFENEGQGRHFGSLPLRSPNSHSLGNLFLEPRLSSGHKLRRTSWVQPPLSPAMLHLPQNGRHRLSTSNLPTKEDFKSLIAEVKEAFRSEISEIRRDIQGMTQKIDHLEAEQADSRRQTTHTQHALHSQSVTLQDMARHLEDLDNRGRRNNIRVRGLSEVEGKEDVRATLQALFSTLLGEPETQVKLDRAHRALRPKVMGGNPRDVVCCVYDFELKERLMFAARKKKNFVFNGDTIQLYQDLSGITLQKRRILRPLLDILHKHDISYRWNFPFALSATKDGITATLSAMEELQEFCDIWNIPTPRLDDWGDLPPQLRQMQNKNQLQQKRRRPRTRAPSQDSYD
ncbi:hypothetical protein GDO81_008823 [Engystomops pustulosus]|uniref:L1 transposable element RRM domain-containing protein n=1 Tax=Engystomops pustulosus TaxID=76066 RepID=A0AAV7CI55_ENGPU|nr:hypothetical protein GDO81_008823 [Engystomops pustulosus]